MSVLVEVGDYEIVYESVSPTLQTRIRVQNQSDENWKGGTAIIHLYFTHGKNQLYINSYTATIASITAGKYETYSLKMPLPAAAVYHTEKIKPEGSDVNLKLDMEYQTGIYNEGKITTFRGHNGNCNMKIRLSDWVKLTAPWGQEVTLVAVSPDAYGKLLELQELICGRNIDEVVDEAYQMMKGKDSSKKEASGSSS